MPCFSNQSALLLHSRTKRFTTPGYFQLGGKPYSMSGIKQHDPSTLVRLSGFAGYKHIYQYQTQLVLADDAGDKLHQISRPCGVSVLYSGMSTTVQSQTIPRFTIPYHT